MKTSSTTLFLGLALSVGILLSAGFAAGNALLDQATPEQKKLYEGAVAKAIAETKGAPLILAKSAENYFWINSAKLIPLLKAYDYSHDANLLDIYVPLQEQILSQRYIHPSKPEWSGWFEYDPGKEVAFKHLALIDHDTIIYYVPVLMFVQDVRGDAKLKEKYGAKADAWLKDVEASIRGWDKRGCWQDFADGSGWYRGVDQYPDPQTGELKKLEGINSGGVVPYNKVHALFEALSLAYRITGDPWYKTRMDKACRFFRSHWRLDDKHAEWNYRDHAFPGDYASGVLGQGKTLTGAFVHPHQGYYVLDVHGVVLAWDLDVFYPKGDIEKLIQTNLEFMAFGDPANPKFKQINGTYKEEGKYDKGMLWPALAHFSQKTRDIWKAEIDADHGKSWLSWSSELDYLIETSQPVSWDHRYAKGDKP